MRKPIILVFGLVLASLANARVIDVVTDGLGSMGHAGTSTDPLVESETIYIKIILRNDPGSGPYPSYDGYVLSTMDVGLHVSGPGTLYEHLVGLAWSDEFGPLAHPEPLIVDNSIAYLGGTSGQSGIQAYPTDKDLVWNLGIHCEGPGYVDVDLTLNGLSEYADYYGASWKPLVEDDLGDLVIHQIPEPATFILLALGGLALLKKRRATS